MKSTIQTQQVEITVIATVEEEAADLRDWLQTHVERHQANDRRGTRAILRARSGAKPHVGAGL